MFAWVASKLTGIPAELGGHQNNLMIEAVSIWQCLYRLNPRYLLMVKEEIDALLEDGFIYPVHNSKWVSPIVVIHKKAGPEEKVKIRVCQDFQKLNATTQKDYFPLPYTDIIMDQVLETSVIDFWIDSPGIIKSSFGW